MKKFRNIAKQTAAALLVFSVLAAVYGCNKDNVYDEGLETLVMTDENGETKVSYRVVVTATDESGEEYIVTEYYVDDKEEAVEANSRAAETTASAKSANGTTAAPDIPDPTTPGATTASGVIKPGTTAKSGKTTTAAGKTTATAAGSTTAKPVTTAEGTTAKETTTKKVTTTKAVTTAETTTYVPVSAISASFTYLKTTDNAAYFASSSTLSDFGLSSDVQKSFKNDPSKWDTYTIAVDFKNTTGSNITVYGLRLTENGKNSVYVAPNSAGVIGYSASDKSAQRIYFNVLVGNSSLSESAVIATIKAMGASIVFSRTPGSDNDAVKKQYSEIK